MRSACLEWALGERYMSWSIVSVVFHDTAIPNPHFEQPLRSFPLRFRCFLGCPPERSWPAARPLHKEALCGLVRPCARQLFGWQILRLKIVCTSRTLVCPQPSQKGEQREDSYQVTSQSLSSCPVDHPHYHACVLRWW